MTAATPSTKSVPLQFSVIYRRSEYVSIVREYLHLELIKRAAAKGKPYQPPGLLSRWCSSAILSAIFMQKRRQMPVNDFSIDAEKIVRLNQRGEISVAWQDIVTIYRFQQGYLLMDKKGGLPIPYRCLTEEQKQQLEVIACSKGLN